MYRWLEMSLDVASRIVSVFRQRKRPRFEYRSSRSCAVGSMGAAGGGPPRRFCPKFRLKIAKFHLQVVENRLEFQSKILPRRRHRKVPRPSRGRTGRTTRRTAAARLCRRSPGHKYDELNRINVRNIWRILTCCLTSNSSKTMACLSSTDPSASVRQRLMNSDRAMVPLPPVSKALNSSRASCLFTNMSDYVGLCRIKSD